LEAFPPSFSFFSPCKPKKSKNISCPSEREKKTEKISPQINRAISNSMVPPPQTPRNSRRGHFFPFRTGQSRPPLPPSPRVRGVWLAPTTGGGLTPPPLAAPPPPARPPPGGKPPPPPPNTKSQFPCPPVKTPTAPVAQQGPENALAPLVALEGPLSPAPEAPEGPSWGLHRPGFGLPGICPLNTLPPPQPSVGFFLFSSPPTTGPSEARTRKTVT